MTPEEREYAEAERANKWALCEKYLVRPYNSSHMHRRGKQHRDWEVREDLRENNCNMILRGRWD